MTYRVYAALIAFLGAAALMTAANETFARAGATPRGAFAPTPSISRPSFAQSLRQHRRNNAGVVWPAEEDIFYGPSNGEATAAVKQPTSSDIHYTYTYDVPWDWAHRYPPAVAPSDRPYVPSCPTETVTFAGHGGEDKSVNVTRCY
jgi:hypothetical protein